MEMAGFKSIKIQKLKDFFYIMVFKKVMDCPSNFPEFSDMA